MHPPPCVEVLTGLENGKKKTQTMGNTQVFPMVLIFSQNKNSQKAKNIKNKISKFKMLLVFAVFCELCILQHDGAWQWLPRPLLRVQWDGSDL